MEEQQLLQGIDTVIIRVSNIQTSLEWYLKKLGLKLIWKEEKMKLAVLDTNGPTSLTLWETDVPVKIDPATASYPIFKTPSASALRLQLSDKGIETADLVKDDYTEYFFFYDPDGNVLEACQVHD